MNTLQSILLIVGSAIGTGLAALGGWQGVKKGLEWYQKWRIKYRDGKLKAAIEEGKQQRSDFSFWQKQYRDEIKKWESRYEESERRCDKRISEVERRHEERQARLEERCTSMESKCEALRRVLADMKDRRLESHLRDNGEVRVTSDDTPPPIGDQR